MIVPHRSLALAIGCLVALAVAPALARAQVVRVHVVEQDGGGAVGGALVALEAGDGRAVGQLLTTPNGVATLRAPSPGEYRVRVLRIAFAAAVSEIFTLAAGASEQVVMRVAPTPVALAGVAVSGTRGACQTHPARARETALLWEEVRKALTSTELTREQRLVPVEMRTFERRLTTRLRVEREQMSEPRLSSERPFFARQAAELARTGYIVRPDGRPVDLTARDAGIRELTFYGPDAHVLLADEFVRDHCFTVERGEGAMAGLVGLAFEPAVQREIVDVKGVLWVDVRAAELRQLEFTYANWNPPVSTPAIGGRLEFERLTSGAWIVKEWAIRMPLFTQAQMPPYRTLLAGYVESGGEAGARLAAVASRVELGRVEGTVADSLTGLPLADATVRLMRSPRTARTDATGRFAIDSLPAGTDGVYVTHSRLDSLGMRLGDRVEIGAGDTTRLALHVPSYGQFRAACSDTSGRGRGIVVGSVRDAEQERMLAGATAVFWWVEVDTTGGRARVGPREVRAITDDAGTYRACGIPTGQLVSAQAHAGGFATGILQLMLDERAVAGRDFLVSLDSTALASGSADDALPLQPRATEPSARIIGAVFDSTGSPFQGARARVDGSAGESVSDEHGRFALERMPPGTQTLDVRAAGFAPVRLVLHLRPARDNPATARLDRVQMLAVVEVRGRRTPRDEIRRPIEERSKLLEGYFIAPEDLTRMGRAPIYMLFDRIPYLLVQSKPEPENRDIPERVQRVNTPPPSGGRGRSREEAAREMPPAVPTLLRTPPREWHINPSDGGLRVYMPGPAGKRCVADVWIDGKLARSEALFGLSADELHAIEVYMRPSDIPMKYRRALDSCGAILVWTIDTTG